MREAEIAALTDEFFEQAFTEASASVLLGSVVQTDDYGDRTITHLRPDARSLARAELHAVPAPEDDGTSVVEKVLLVLRLGQTYSRSALEAMFGEARKVAGPRSADGDVSYQLEFDVERGMQGVVRVRWWVTASDSDQLGDPDGPDEVRGDEIELQRVVLPEIDVDEDLVDEDGAGRATVPPAEATIPLATVDLDEAMDTGAWIGDLAWRILRHDFTLAMAREMLGASPAGSESDGERVMIRPGDPRLDMAMIRVEGDRVLEVRLDASSLGPLVLAVAAVSDRLNAQPVAQPGEITFQFESTRSRGSVSLVLAQANAMPGPIAVVNMIEVAREA